MFLLFWPFMLASIIFSLVALSKRKPVFLVISFFLLIPFSLYIAATPLFKWWGLILPLFFLAAALLLRNNRMWLSALCILPVILVIGWMGVIVITQ